MMKVLVIDDERTVLKTVNSQLRDMDQKRNLGLEQIDLAGSAEEAREYMKHDHYDIFLCDIVMPGEDGITFARWVLERCPDAKIIFLTAYADVQFMKEAISMQSFDYVFQPVDPGELQSVVERAASQIKIERKNLELADIGAFFQTNEMDILEKEALWFLQGKNQDNAYLRRLIAAYNINPSGESVYLPVLISILKTRRRIRETEKSILRLIYKNILDEVFQTLQVLSIVLLEEIPLDFIVLLYWKRDMAYEREVFADKLESFRILLERVLETEAAIYCGEVGEPTDLPALVGPLFQARTDNVRRESRVFLPRHHEKEIGPYSFELQLSTWKKLLEQNQFLNFRDSIMAYISKGDYRTRMNAAGMMNLHQRVTQLLLLYMVDHQIGSDMIFDEQLPFLTYMNTWQGYDIFEAALSHIADRLSSITDSGDSGDVVQKSIKYIKQHLDTELLVSEIADYAGMNPEYLSKLFKKTTGMTLKEYIVNDKMEAAKMLLATTDLPVTLISDHVGYANYSNFTRSFKQLIGLTPKEYRKEAARQKM